MTPYDTLCPTVARARGRLVSSRLASSRLAARFVALCFGLYFVVTMSHMVVQIRGVVRCHEDVIGCHRVSHNMVVQIRGAIVHTVAHTDLVSLNNDE